MSRRRRNLSGEERALWESVQRTVAPLRPEEIPPEPEPAAPPPPVPALPVEKMPAAGAKAVKAPAKSAPPPLHPIERRTISRLARGVVQVDDRIDLHGLTQLAAHERLHGFLRRAQASGARLVLVITGKGRPGVADGFEDRGVLRRRVPHWLAEPGLRSVVIGFEEAHRAHGGGGALYVRIRKGHGADRNGSS